MTFLSEMPKVVRRSHAKYFRNQTYRFLVIDILRFKIMTSQTEQTLKHHMVLRNPRNLSHSKHKLQRLGHAV